MKRNLREKTITDYIRENNSLTKCRGRPKNEAVLYYDQAHLCWKERMRFLIEGLVLVWLLSLLFYASMRITLLCTPLSLLYARLRNHTAVYGKQRKLNYQFKDAMVTFYGLLSAGQTIEAAMIQGTKDLSLIYGENTFIMCELRCICHKLEANIPIEKCFEDLAARSKDDDIASFAQILHAAKRSGGSMPQVIRTTVDTLSMKISVRQEIETIITGRKHEFYIMACIPLAIILYLLIFSYELVRVLYTTVAGRGIMTLCLLVYAAAIAWGHYILNIEV